MANPPAITDYTNRDYESLLQSLLDQAALKLPEWTDRSENDLGRMLLESFAYLGDVLLYYQDRIANEAFLATAVERRSVIDLLSLLGYTLATPAPATAELTLTIANDSSEPICVELGAKFATQASPGNPALEFVFLPVDNHPLVISRDGTGGSRVYPGPHRNPPEPKLVVTQASQISHESLGRSSQEANQAFRLKQRPVLLSREPNQEMYLTVEVDSGSGFQRWSRRGTLIYSTSDSTHFTVQVDDSDQAEIVFGDDRCGKIPPFNSEIRASYLIGGGSIGNVGKHTITQVKSGVTPTTVEITNEQAASGGADRESIDHARRQAPAVYRSQHRAVTAADFVALARNFPGVAKASVVAPGWNYVDIYVVAAGNTQPSDDLRARLLQYFDDKRMLTTLVSIRQPSFVDIAIRVKNLGIEPNYYVEDVKRRVEAAIAALFVLDRLEFGQSFYLSKVYEAIEGVPGVAFVQMDPVQRHPGAVSSGDSGVIHLLAQEFPRQGEFKILTVTGGLK